MQRASAAAIWRRLFCISDTLRRLSAAFFLTLLFSAAPLSSAPKASLMLKPQQTIICLFPQEETTHPTIKNRITKTQAATPNYPPENCLAKQPTKPRDMVKKAFIAYRQIFYQWIALLLKKKVYAR